MGAIKIRKVLGYEICYLEKEGSLLHGDTEILLLIRKAGFTEFVNIEKQCKHEIGEMLT